MDKSLFTQYEVREKKNSNQILKQKQKTKSIYVENVVNMQLIFEYFIGEYFGRYFLLLLFLVFHISLEIKSNDWLVKSDFM